MYNNDSDSLNAGAYANLQNKEGIRLTGNQQMASDPSGGAELYQVYQNALQSGQIPKGTTFEMFKHLLQQSKAPQQNSGIMAAGPRGTYTQRRRTQMAGGGIMGSNNGSMLVAPTADGSRPGYGAIWDFTKKFIPDAWEPALETMGNVVKDYIPFIGDKPKMPTPTFPETEQGDYDIYGNKIPETGGEDKSIWEKGWDVAKKVGETIVPGGKPGYINLYDGEPGEPGLARQAANIGVPMAAGKWAYDYQKDYLAKQPKFPGDTTGINFQTARQAMDDPNLRFKPKAQYADMAQGGRIGYAGGGDEGFSGVHRARRIWGNLPNDIQGKYKGFHDFFMGGDWEGVNMAQGGRIGYADAGSVLSEEQNAMVTDMLKRGMGNDAISTITGATPEQIKVILDSFLQEAKAQGGRIGYLHGERVNDMEIPEWHDIYEQELKDRGGWKKDPGYAFYGPGLESLKTQWPKSLLKKIIERRRAQLEKFEDIPSSALSTGVPRTEEYSTTRPSGMDVNYASGGRIGYAGGSGSDDETQTYQDNVKWLIEMGFSPEEAHKMAGFERDKPKVGKAQGGRIGAEEGGLMNLGGMEKDYRQEGGFVPIGGKEKADDVPARLSKNEFVFTADAVRAAGGGNIDKGASIMENLMENLEAGGKVSEESQGLEGARNMFANAQQLEKRII